MSTYKFSYKRKLLWKTTTVIGHRYDEHTDKMALFLPDGGILELSHWKDCTLRLGSDWVLAQKKMLEEQAGQSVPMKVGG